MKSDAAFDEHLDRQLRAALRGAAPAWPDGVDSRRLIERARFHGIGTLAFDRESASCWPDDARRQLRQDAIDRAMWELCHQQLLATAIEQLVRSGVQPIVLKGSALAYSIYPEPVWRERSDTDLLIPPHTRHQVHELLVAMGFEPDVAVSGDYVSYQANYTHRTPNAGRHTLDVHWKINNSELLSQLFDYDELLARATPVPRLAAGALAAAPVHALLLACMHRATHRTNPIYLEGQAHDGANRLIWIYDIHLLAATLGAADWAELAALARAKGMAGICLESLQLSQRCFGTACPEEALSALAQGGGREAATAYLGAGALHQRWMDWCALPGHPQRLQWLRETLFPNPAYMRRKYAGQRLRWLPWLYIKRALNGIASRMG